jgi:hypothetical protein
MLLATHVQFTTICFLSSRFLRHKLLFILTTNIFRFHHVCAFFSYLIDYDPEAGNEMLEHKEAIILT